MDGFLIFCIKQELILFLRIHLVFPSLKLLGCLIRFRFEKNVFKSLNNALFGWWGWLLSWHLFRMSFSLLNEIFNLLVFINSLFLCTIVSITLIWRVFIGIITITRIAYIIKLLNNPIFKVLNSFGQFEVVCHLF